MLLCIEGIDASGKATQSKILFDRLGQSGFNCEMIAFPDYRTPVGLNIRAYLDGKLSLSSEVRQLLYVANRWERRDDIVDWLNSGKFVVADRYIPSGLAYGLANGLDLDWMLALEKGLPVPSLVIVLDVSVEDTAKRYLRKRDAYESRESYLKKVRESYLSLSEKFGWAVVNGELAIEAVSESIWSVVSDKIRE
ncbi:MAG: dTMP kinase [Candidatus Bathyarchaeota archaeon]|nr:MAG: dTMP kinase [Candidatus Bathyarchaeota archaeon]